MTEKKKSRWRNIIAHAITVLAVFLLALIFPVNCFAEDYSAVVTLAKDKKTFEDYKKEEERDREKNCNLFSKEVK